MTIKVHFHCFYPFFAHNLPRLTTPSPHIRIKPILIQITQNNPVEHIENNQNTHILTQNLPSEFSCSCVFVQEIFSYRTQGPFL